MASTIFPQRLLLIVLLATLLSIGAISCASRLSRSTTSSGNANPIHVVLPTELRELVNANRKIALPPPVHNLTEVMTGFQTPNLTAEADEATAQRIIQSRQRRTEQPTTLTHAEIINELDFLFNVLRYGYGAYQYFGGDDVFLPLKQSMLAQLPHMRNPISTSDYIRRFLVPSLRSVIADNHFWIDRYSIGVRSHFYINENYILHRTEDGYITEIDGQTYLFRRATLDGQAVVLPTLTGAGEFAWTFGYVDYNQPPAYTASPTFYLTVQLQNMATNITSTRTIQLLHVVPNTSQLSTELYSITRREEIPILSNRRLTNPVPPSFVATGARLRDEPVLILDLRGHGGGNDGYAWQWIYQYTGERVANSVFAGNVLMSATVGQVNQWGTVMSPPQWRLRQHGVTTPTIPNENLVVVLTDNIIGSTGDAFVGMLRQLENVLIVGTNTRGMLVTGNVGSVPLPYSRANVSFGIHLNIMPDLSQFEGVGVPPDLWVPPNASLERVIRFINNLDVVDIAITRADTDAAAFAFINSLSNTFPQLGDFEGYEITNAERRGIHIVYNVRATHANGFVTYTFRVDDAGAISAFSYVVHLHEYEQIAVNFIETFFSGDIAGTMPMWTSFLQGNASEESLQGFLNQVVELAGDFIGFTLAEPRAWNIGFGPGSRYNFLAHFTGGDVRFAIAVNHAERKVYQFSADMTLRDSEERDLSFGL